MVNHNQVQNIRAAIQSQKDFSVNQVTPETEALLFLASDRWCPKSLVTVYKKSREQLKDILEKQLFIADFGNQMAQLVKVIYPELAPAAEEFGQKLDEFLKEHKNLSEDKFWNNYDTRSREIAKSIVRRHHLKEHYNLQLQLTDEQKISMKKWMKEYKNYISPGEDRETVKILQGIKYNGSSRR